jgi:hypothetical protein
MPPTFARAQIESILLDAARLDDARGAESPGVALARMGNGDLTLAEVERAAAEVGISRAAVSIAALRLALRDAHAASPRAHGEQEIAGELSGEARERLADAIRTRVSPSTVRTTADGVDVEIGKGNGEPGSLLVQVRSKGGATTISVWSASPVLSGGDIASGAALGVPAFLFPIVAASSGQWPALAAAVALGGAGALAGTGVAIAVKRRMFERWRARVEEAVTAIATSASGLVGER